MRAKKARGTGLQLHLCLWLARNRERSLFPSFYGPAATAHNLWGTPRMARNRRRQANCSAWHRNFDDCWYATVDGKRTELRDELGAPIICEACCWPRQLKPFFRIGMACSSGSSTIFEHGVCFPVIHLLRQVPKVTPRRCVRGGSFASPSAGRLSNLNMTAEVGPTSPANATPPRGLLTLDQRFPRMTDEMGTRKILPDRCGVPREGEDNREAG